MARTPSAEHVGAGPLLPRPAPGDANELLQLNSVVPSQRFVMGPSGMRITSGWRQELCLVMRVRGR